MATATLSSTYDTDNPRASEEDDKDYQEFTSEKSLSDKDQRELVQKLDCMFNYALMHPSWKAGRSKMVQCFKYREGEQWTTAEKAALEERHQPDTVNNQIAVVVNKLVGDVVNQRVRLGYRGRNEKLDQAEADLLSDIFLFIRQSNDLEFEERDMADDGFTAGMGVLDVSVTFDELAQPFIKIRHEDPLIVFPDPDSRRYDWNEDGKFVARANWWKIEDAVEAYPQAEQGLKRVMGSSQVTGDDTGAGQLSEVDHFTGQDYVDKDSERIRVIEVQYKKKEREQLVIFSDGRPSKVFTEKKEVWEEVKAAKAAGVQHRIIDRLKHRICVGTYAGGVLLEHKETDHAYFSLVPYFAYRRKSGEPYSLITLALSMQDAINKRESKALALLTMNQIITEKSAVDDPQKAAEEIAKPDGYIEVRDGALSGEKFRIEKNVELAATQFQMHQRAQEDLFKIMGMDPRMGQQTGELRSGAGLQRKYMEASKPVATLFDNIRRTRKIMGRVVMDRVQKYYTPETTMLITDSEDQQRVVGITADMMERIKTRVYDVVPEELEDTATAQQEQVNQLMQILPQVIPLGPFWVSQILKLTTLRQKDELLNDLKALSGPPPAIPKVNMQANLDALQPIERAGVWDIMGRKDIAQAVMQQQPKPTNEMKAEVDLAKDQSKGKVDPQQIAVDQAKSQGEQQKIMLEMQALQAEHEMKMKELEMKLSVDMQKHSMAMEKQAFTAITSKNKESKTQNAT